MQENLEISATVDNGAKYRRRGYDARVPSKSTKADRVFDRLRGDILAGRHHPGERLRYSELCDSYATSTGVLREALLRLAEQGLVIGEAQHGFRVVPLSPADLRELTEARSELETLTLRLAMTNGDIDWESRLIAAHHKLARTEQLDPEDPERLSDVWVSAHEEFHAALLDGCTNQRLKSIAGTLRASAELYRRWSVPLGRESERDVPAEHAAILEATIARDITLATDRLGQHVRLTTEILLASQGADGDVHVAEPPAATSR